MDRSARMQMRVFNLLILLLSFSAFSYAQEKVKKRDLNDSDDPVLRAHKAKVASEKVRGKIQRSDERLKSNPHLNGERLKQLEEQKDLNEASFNQSMAEEHKALDACLADPSLSWHTKNLIEDYLKLLDRLWKPKAYVGYYTKYTVRESSSIIGESNYDVEIERDPIDPKVFYIKNFYNIGFNHKIKVIQEGMELKMASTYNSSSVIGSGSVSESGLITMNVTVDDGSTPDMVNLSFVPIK